MEKEHQGYRRNDAYYQLSREEQLMIFRLHTGHNRLKHHILSKLKIGTTDMWHRQNDSTLLATKNMSSGNFH
jgi:hypothetical protein